MLKLGVLLAEREHAFWFLAKAWALVAEISQGEFSSIWCMFCIVRRLWSCRLCTLIFWAVTGNIQMPWLGVSASVLSPHTIYWAVIHSKYSSYIPSVNGVLTMINHSARWLTKYNYNPNTNNTDLQVALINIVLMLVACWSDTLYQFLCMYPKY